MPRPNIRSVADILAVADAMEREAAARYAMLADCMRRVDQREIVELLERLAAEERGHMDGVERLAQRAFQSAHNALRVRSSVPQTFAREEEATAAVLLSPYRTLSATRLCQHLHSGPNGYRLLPPAYGCHRRIAPRGGPRARSYRPAVRRQEDSRWSMMYSSGCTFVLQDTVD